MLCNGDLNISYYDLGLAEMHSHEQENKISTDNSNKKYQFSTIWIIKILINTNNSHKQHSQNSQTQNLNIPNSATTQNITNKLSTHNMFF